MDGRSDRSGWEGPLDEIAEAYYRVATAAIRRHDPHHLILGDRYGTRAGAPEPVLDAMAKYVDVLSVQTFPGRAVDRAMATIARWHERTGLPVLIADTGNWCPAVMSPHRTGSEPDQAARADGYELLVGAFAAEDWILGWHWCSYVENPQRGFGLKDPWDEPYEELVARVAEVNRRA